MEYEGVWQSLSLPEPIEYANASERRSRRRVQGGKADAIVRMARDIFPRTRYELYDVYIMDAGV